MKNHRAITTTRVIFIISVLYSYNVNASLYNAISSLISLFDEIHLKQFQLNEQRVSVFSNLEFNDSVILLRIYHASLLARRQQGTASSKEVYIKRMESQFLRCLHGDSDRLMVQGLATHLMSASGGIISLSSHMGRDVHGFLQSEDFCKTDNLKDEEIYAKAKEHLSTIYESLKNDNAFLTACANFGLESDYKTTIELISTALQ
ncbi:MULTISPECIES: hypothetical protein [unclassified Endozoicomonas]|uniref:hypothetical protein n=1 Tax=unclassified Endozoicomonas TaxID=2644528 RepID=UPI002147D22A|nr:MULTISPECIES: hypothetical protein [unclassified Endozoicomonas]